MKNNIESQRPRFKTRAHDHSYHLFIALPGVAQDALQVNLERRLLTIGGNRKELAGEFESLDQEALHYELKVELHEDLDTENIRASYQNGILTLHLQKRKELAPRKINILAN